MGVYRPIVFVHGWGGVADFARDFDESDERDPYNGWNTGHRYNDPDGWVQFRQSEPNFEGLVLRLVKEHLYYDASNDEHLHGLTRSLGGADTTAPGQYNLAPTKTLWVFRYYEHNASHLRLPPHVEQRLADELKLRGYAGESVGVPRYAALLAAHVQRIAGSGPSLTDDSGTIGLNLGPVYLVAHSMGGLISRFALQYNLFGVGDQVAKLMTLATPHGGARYAQPTGLLKLLPAMRDDDVTFLDTDWVGHHLGGQQPRPALPAALDVFALAGTRHEGYFPIARRLPRTDGIVHQTEAWLAGYPYAYVYNTHSGYYGIRENHNAYQSLRRFLFGDLRVTLTLSGIALKPESGFSAKARFFFQFYVKPRGINAHLNEISERAGNQPKPRTLDELQASIANYVVYDGFADSGLRNDAASGELPAGARPTRDVPHLQLEHLTFADDSFVGGRVVGGNTTMVPLAEGDHEFVIEDQVFTATLRVKVAQRSAVPQPTEGATVASSPAGQ